MSKAALFMSWSDVKTGRETDAVELFGQTLNYWNKQQTERKIDSFEPVILQPNGGGLQGFFIARGDSAKLDALRETNEFREIEARGVMYLKNYGIAYAMIGEGLQRQMQVWAKSIPKR